MAETKPKTAKELVEKAKNSIPEGSSGRLAVVAVAAAVLEVAGEIRACRGLLERLVAQADRARPAEARRTMSALAGELPPGVDRVTPCRSCSAPMYWVATTTGKKMPLDAKPLEGAAAADGFGIRAGVASKSYEGPKYSSHFSTCPDADKHRSSRA